MPILSSIIEKDIAVDLGTDTTILYVAGSGIRLREPTVVAMDRQTCLLYTSGAADEL